MPAEPSLCFGAHVSASGGLDRALERGVAIAADCIQVFTRNQRQWRPKPLTEEEIAAFHAARRDSPLGPVMSHGSYPVNLAAVEPGKQQKSIATMEAELERCHQLGVELLNFHPGAHVGTGIEEGIGRIARALNGICQRHPDKADVTLVLENVAGQGTTVGASFAELRGILERLDRPERFAICLDTAHAFGAGYDLASEAGWEAAWTDFERELGGERLAAFHLNDSAAAFDSRKDRHANLGHGHIGATAFHRVVREPRTRDRPMYLETPGGPPAWKREIAWLRRCARGEYPPAPEIPTEEEPGPSRSGASPKR